VQAQWRALLGVGGMLTKLALQRALAARSGAGTVIVGGRIERVIEPLQRARAGYVICCLKRHAGLRVAVVWPRHLQTRWPDCFIDEGA